MGRTAVIVYFDLESASADALFTYGPGFVRIAGAAVDDGEHVAVTTDCAKLVRLLERADMVVGHNIIKFDLMALARNCGADYTRLCRNAVDTLVLARLQDPPGAKGQRPWSEKGYYSLDHVAQRLGVQGKTDSVTSLADRWGGFDKIPVDDHDYRAYLAGDVRANRAVFQAMGGPAALTDYQRREMRVVALQNQMTINGCRVDVQLLKERVAQEEKRQADAVEHLVTEGLQLGREVQRGRAPNKWTEFEPFKNPLGTSEGRAWLGGVWERFGVTKPPRTAPTKDHPKGQLALGKDKLALVRNHERCPAELARILDAIAAFTGASAKYAEVSKYVLDDRVHASIGAAEQSDGGSGSTDQASGRWAMTKPSLTNLGKRGAKVVERAVFVPEEGHVLIACDLDQVDMRGIAGHCQDPNYIAMFQPGMDYHAEVARMLGVTRNEAKPLGHGANYGMGREGMIARGHDPQLVHRYFDMVASRFAVKEQWTKDVRDKGRSGELLDNGFGRLMRCDPERAHTQAPALMGQGTARDLMTTAMLRLVDAVPEAYDWFRFVVHDEVVLSVPEKDAEEIGREVLRAFTFDWNGVPITAGLSKPGRDWAACYAKD